MLPSTEERIIKHTDASINAKIHAEMLCRIESLKDASKSEINERLVQLDREWDIERTLEANAAAISLSGVILAATRSRTWLLVPAVVTGFLLQHALQGWCPPLPLFRRMRIRTAGEIAEERYALRNLRDDLTVVKSAQGV